MFVIVSFSVSEKLHFRLNNPSIYSWLDCDCAYLIASQPYSMRNAKSRMNASPLQYTSNFTKFNHWSYTMSPDYAINRPAITCPNCALHQFKPLSGLCRRCNRPLVYSFAYKRKTLTNVEPAILSTESLAKSIGSKIRRQRKMCKISQHRLATISNTARPSLSRIENGIVLPSLNTLCRISAALGLELHELFISNR